MRSKSRHLGRDFIIKLGLFVIILLLLGPYFFHLKLTEDTEESYKDFMIRKQQEKVGKWRNCMNACTSMFNTIKKVCVRVRIHLHMNS